MVKYILDPKIKPLVDYFNSLSGIETFGSCQGHNDGGVEKRWFYPYIKFKCTNNRSLGLLATIEYIFSDIGSVFNITKEEEKKVLRYKLNAFWSIEVVANNDHRKENGLDPNEYALYVLKADSGSFNKPSEIYDDFALILNWYRLQESKFINEDIIVNIK